MSRPAHTGGRGGAPAATGFTLLEVVIALTALALVTAHAIVL